MSQLIDPYTGAVRLEKGLILTPGLTPDELIKLVGARPTGSFSNKCWYTDIRMETEFGAFTMGLFFKKEELFQFQASLLSSYGPSGPLIKSRHDEMLIALLGKPKEERPVIRGFISKIFYRSHGQAWHSTAKELVWKYPWGTVSSTVEPRDGSAMFQVLWKA